MSKNIEERLKAALSRREAKERASESELEDRKRSEGVQEEILNSAIEDWNSRILPSVNSCIRQANDILNTKDFRLHSASASLYRIIHPTRHPPSLDFQHRTRSNRSTACWRCSVETHGSRMAQSPRLQLGNWP